MRPIHLSACLLLALPAAGPAAAACAPSADPCAELVKPAERDARRWAEARCNDGTPFAFYVRESPTGSHDWVVWLEGGGFCDDLAKPCSERAGSHSSTPAGGDGESVAFPANGGLLNPDPGANPVFWAANHVFANYCSSDGWTGATAGRRPTTGDPLRGWHFSGRINVRVMLEVLAEEHGLDDRKAATRVLLGGGSSGGLGALANADLAVDRLPRTAAAGRLKVLSDAGLSHDFDHPGYRMGAATVPDREVFRHADDFFGSRFLAPCEAAHAEEPHRCFLSEVLPGFVSAPAPTGLGLPLLIQHSSLDSFALDLHGIDLGDPADMGVAIEWQKEVLAALAPIERVFSGGRPPYHTIATSDERWGMGPPGAAFRDVLARFWEGGPAERILFDKAEVSPGAACLPGPTAHCFQQGRFRVEATWQDFEGRTGAGTTIPCVSDDSGLFWFFGPENWEVLVKVLDGCGVNDAFWVFAAATTNVGYVVRVTDLSTGSIRLYPSTLGVASPAVTDTGAFPGC